MGKTPPTPGGKLDQSPSNNNTSARKANTPATSKAEAKDGRQVRHIFPSYKRRFRVLLAGHPDNSSQQQILEHYNINLSWVNGVHIPLGLKGVAFAYFVSHEMALNAVKEWKGTDSFMFLQRVSTLYRYKVDLPFNIPNLKKVIGEVKSVVSMNYSPSNNFWAVNVENLLDNKPNFLSEIDVSTTTLRLTWDSDRKLQIDALKKVIISAWKLNPELDINNNTAYVKVKREELKKSTLTKIIYVGDVVVTNLSFNPRLNKPSLITKVKELVQHAISEASLVDPTRFVLASAYTELQSRVDSLVKENQALKTKNDELEKSITNINTIHTNDFKELNTSINNIRTHYTNLDKNVLDKSVTLSNHSKENNEMKVKVAKIDGLLDEITSLQIQLSQLQSSFTTTETKINTLSEDSNKRNTQVQEMLAELDTDYENTYTMIGALDDKLTELSTDVQTFLPSGSSHKPRKQRKQGKEALTLSDDDTDMNGASDQQ
ncbi:predicted protein [Naegleria gruberi]|uniref:Predicted protein n=1 Tax=Naegleria gruberi TaxID=5762 RepID=D2VGC8_NAEGR|nr:uncharacterized protein NAEGRDRAFT_67931 [Naegleria gruberi]EFC44045.1 predicted protein [Naegleria gruberi]|eukprot:XP_002676789.1 predicted protein [Naegleria gruberi strain NEG-M]